MGKSIYTIHYGMSMLFINITRKMLIRTKPIIIRDKVCVIKSLSS